MKNVTIPNDAIFIFDLHGVVFKLSRRQVINHIIKSRAKLQLVKTLLYPRRIFNTLFSLKKGSVAEEILLGLAKDFPEFEKLVPTGFNIINAQKPITQTVEIIKKLKSKGYKALVFSNIGDRSLQMLQEKFPEIFCLFDGILGCTRQDNYIKKPHPEAFQKCINFFNVDKSKVIFIDDKKKNVEAAQKLGIKSILFKNPKDLYKKLITT